MFPRSPHTLNYTLYCIAEIVAVNHYGNTREKWYITKYIGKTNLVKVIGSHSPTVNQGSCCILRSYHHHHHPNKLCNVTVTMWTAKNMYPVFVYGWLLIYDNYLSFARKCFWSTEMCELSWNFKKTKKKKQIPNSMDYNIIIGGCCCCCWFAMRPSKWKQKKLLYKTKTCFHHYLYRYRLMVAWKGIKVGGRLKVVAVGML